MEGNETFAEDLSGEEALERVADIARHLAEANSLDETLQHVVDLAVDYIEQCHGASLMVVSSAGVITPAFTDPASRSADEAQHAFDEGPCLTSLLEHETIVIEDIDSEQRWPRWRRTVAELEWRSMVGLRLFVAEDTMGALNLYSRQPHGFGPRSQALGQVFASHAAVAMKAAISVAGLHRALESRDIIGQAKGVLMERERISGRQAFDRLQRLSNDHNAKVRDIAQDIATTGRIPD